jgi:hypothetical protein
MSKAQAALPTRPRTAKSHALLDGDFAPEAQD